MKRFNPLQNPKPNLGASLPKQPAKKKLLPSERLGVPPTTPDVDLKVAACQRPVTAGQQLRAGIVDGLRNSTLAFMLSQEATRLDPSAPLKHPGDAETAKDLLLTHWNAKPHFTDWRDAWASLQKVTFGSREPKAPAPQPAPAPEPPAPTPPPLHQSTTPASLTHTFPEQLRCKTFAGRIRQVVARQGRIEDFEQALRNLGEGEFHLRIEKSPWMPLVIEILPASMCPAGVPAVSVCHYGEQNGDAMMDPEIVFACLSLTEWVPYEITQHYVGVHRSAFEPIADGSTPFNPRTSKAMIELVNIWGKNLKEQGFCDAPEPAEGSTEEKLKKLGAMFTVGAVLDDKAKLALESLKPEKPRKIVPAEVFAQAVSEMPPAPGAKPESALDRLLKLSIPD